jgi:protoheme IX farnesyltransferase
MYTTIANNSFMYKAKQLWALLKFRLSALVVFSGGFGYLMGVEGAVDWVKLLALIVGSFSITGGANTINQIIEKDLDKLMRRTAERPLPTGRLTSKEAVIWALATAILGTVVLAVFVNVLTASLSLFSLILYGFVYTPLKQRTPISVLVGAFPGAFPPLIGWAAATGGISVEAIILFGIQFFWQFPHFWAIAWVGNDDYTRAGFKMLPSGGKDINTATHIMLYTTFLLPICLLPLQTGMAGVVSAVVSVLATVVFLGFTFRLLWLQTDKAALGVMFCSFLYLPVVQIAFLLDKI